MSITSRACLETHPQMSYDVMIFTDVTEGMSLLRQTYADLNTGLP